VAAASVALGVLLLGVFAVAPSRFGLLLLLGAGGFVAVVLGLRSPVLATIYLLLATFFRLAVPSGTLPVDPFLLAFGGVVTSVWIWGRRRSAQLAAVGAIECAMALYVVWNVGSMIASHPYPPGAPLDPSPFSVVRFIFIGIVMPYTMFLVGRQVFSTEAALRCLLWTLLGTAAYSAAVSIMQIHGPASLVWPRYILDNPYWPGRAVGVFNQPVVNGLVLIVGFLVAVLVASHGTEPRWLRALAIVIGAASAYAIYLTHTRAVWLSFALVVLIGAVKATGFRAGFVVTGVVMAMMVTATWSTFTSTNRAAGGVASPTEAEDRLNAIATSIWAVEQKPWFGWGIGRFAAVNTYHHQQWSPRVPWQRGFGIPSHLDSLGVFAELGVVGLALWVTVIVLVLVHVVRAARRLPARGLCNRPFALTALLCLIAQVTTGLTVDLRFFDFPNLIVMLLVGAAIGRGQQHHLREAATRVAVSAPATRVGSGPADVGPVLR
jgi:O-antigen ligase